MTLKNSVLEAFKQIAGKTNVLTDTEDLYVYSFEHLFRERQRRRLEAVVRVSSSEQAKKATELANREGLTLIRRGAKHSELAELSKGAVVLLDDAVPPELTTFDAKNEARRAEGEKEIYRAGHGTFRNFALALKSLFQSLPASKCSDCNVCSGYCTVSSSFNGIETWSSKGRTLLTHGLFTGELKPSPKVTDVLHTCSLCGLCFAQCFPDTQVRKAIMRGRRLLAEEGMSPETATSAAKNIFEFGDPSGMSVSRRVAWTEELPQKRVFPKEADILYWAGCVVAGRIPKVAKALADVLTRAQIDFTMLNEKEGCCGYVLLATGLWREAEENALKLVERVKATKAEALVTPCAGCYYTFTKMYPEILGVQLPCQVFHASQYIEPLIEDGNLALNDLDLNVTYHDPCSLGRHGNVFDSPRNVLSAVPNLKLIEMAFNRNRARCCGAGGGLWSFNNSVAMNSAYERLLKDVAPLGVDTLATACPTCNINLRYTAVRKSMGIKVYDIVEIVALALS